MYFSYLFTVIVVMGITGTQMAKAQNTSEGVSYQPQPTSIE